MRTKDFVSWCEYDCVQYNNTPAAVWLTIINDPISPLQSCGLWRWAGFSSGRCVRDVITPWNNFGGGGGGGRATFELFSQFCQYFYFRSGWRRGGGGLFFVSCMCVCMRFYCFALRTQMFLRLPRWGMGHTKFFIIIFKFFFYYINSKIDKVCEYFLQFIA